MKAEDLNLSIIISYYFGSI